MLTSNVQAPGSPGIEPRWTSGAKTGVGTALSNKSRVWFTLSHGIFNAIYYPRIDQAFVRDMGLIVADGANFFKGDNDLGGYHPVWSRDMVETAGALLAVEIAALLAAADLADLNHELSIATYLREIADVWNTSIERWIYASGTDWCRKFSVKGYYVRIETGEVVSRFQKTVHVKNVAAAEDTRLDGHLVSPDALALVRFGLRAADDPRIRDTVKIIDTLLKVETPSGLTWHRYNDDGYGEHEDGAPFDGAGKGLGIHLAGLSTKALPEGKHWEGKNFIVHVGSWPQDGSGAEKRGQADEK